MRTRLISKYLVTASVAVTLAIPALARKPGEPSVVCVTRRIEFHLPYPWQIT